MTETLEKNAGLEEIQDKIAELMADPAIQKLMASVMDRVREQDEKDIAWLKAMLGDKAEQLPAGYVAGVFHGGPNEPLELVPLGGFPADGSGDAMLGTKFRKAVLTHEFAEVAQKATEEEFDALAVKADATPGGLSGDQLREQRDAALAAREQEEALRPLLEKLGKAPHGSHGHDGHGKLSADIPHGTREGDSPYL